MATFEEGCLSVPEIWDEVERPARIKAEYLDRDGKRQELEADGLLATCLQHEMDHLEGVLFLDHLSKLKRTMALKKLQKAKKLQEAG
jgi:peptide deformylase